MKWAVLLAVASAIAALAFAVAASRESHWRNDVCALCGEDDHATLDHGFTEAGW